MRGAGGRKTFSKKYEKENIPLGSGCAGSSAREFRVSRQPPARPPPAAARVSPPAPARPQPAGPRPSVGPLPLPHPSIPRRRAGSAVPRAARVCQGARSPSWPRPRLGGGACTTRPRAGSGLAGAAPSAHTARLEQPPQTPLVEFFPRRL